MPSAPLSLRTLGVVGRFDVRLEPDRETVRGHARQTAELVERLLELRALAAARTDLRQRLLIGLDDHFARGAVDGDERARWHLSAGVPQAHHGRYANRTCEDRCVVRPAPLVAHQRRQPIPFQLRHDGRRQLVGDEHERPLELAEQVQWISAGAQVPAQADRRRLQHRRAARAGTDRRLGRKAPRSRRASAAAPVSAFTREVRMMSIARSISMRSSSISSCASNRYACSAPTLLAIRSLMCRICSRAASSRRLQPLDFARHPPRRHAETEVTRRAMQHDRACRCRYPPRRQARSDAWLP